MIMILNCKDELAAAIHWFWLHSGAKIRGGRPPMTSVEKLMQVVLDSGKKSRGNLRQPAGERGSSQSSGVSSRQASIAWVTQPGEAIHFEIASLMSLRNPDADDDIESSGSIGDDVVPDSLVAAAPKAVVVDDIILDKMRLQAKTYKQKQCSEIRTVEDEIGELQGPLARPLPSFSSTFVPANNVVLSEEVKASTHHTHSKPVVMRSADLSQPPSDTESEYEPG